jgi:hypothetical protein
LNQNEVIPIDETKVRYPKQWLGVEVVERDEESGQPIMVKVLAKNMDLFQIRKNVAADNICTFYTGPIPETSLVLMF